MTFWTRSRRQSRNGALVGGAVSLVVFALVLWIVGTPSMKAALAAVLFVPGLVVFVLTGAVALGRFWTHRFDPLQAAAPESRAFQINQRVLSNSVEQGIIFVTLGGALVLMGGAWAYSTALALAITFGLARLAFWLGYQRSTFGRSPGMAATMLTNLATLLLALGVLLF